MEQWSNGEMAMEESRIEQWAGGTGIGRYKDFGPKLGMAPGYERRLHHSTRGRRIESR
jgi:hypothetical protein